MGIWVEGTYKKKTKKKYLLKVAQDWCQLVLL